MFVRLVLVLTLFASSAIAQGNKKATGWNSFRNGDQQRGVATTRLPEKPELLWELKSPDGWLSSVAIRDGRVYAPALEGHLYCLDLKTGKQIWKYRSIKDKDPDKFAAGFKAAPTIVGDTIYIGDEDGFFHAVDLAKGKGKWKFETRAEIAGGAAAFGKNLLVPSHDGSLYNVSPEGKEVWSFETQDRVNCSPAIADGFTFVAGCDEHLRVIDIKKKEEVRAVPLGSYLIASPALHGDMLYVGTYAGEVIALNWKTGKYVWRYKFDREMEIHASAAVTDEVVLVGGHDKIMHCIDRKTGKRRWQFKTNARINSSPAVVGRRVFFGSDDGNIYGVSLATGKEEWKFTAGKDVSAGMAIGDGCLVIGSAGTNGRLYCFGKPLREQTKSDKKTGASP